MRRIVQALLACVLVAACASAPSPLAPTPRPPADATSPAGDPSPTLDPSAVADVAIVTCTDGAPEIPQPHVRPQPDGVHLRVFRAVGRYLSIEFENGSDGLTVETEGQIVVMPIPPQVVGIRCESTGPEPVPGTDLEIVDPLRVYRDPGVTVREGSCANLSIDYAPNARGEVGDPVVIVRRQLGGLRSGDVVERAGYLTPRARSVRVVRAGVTVANVTLVGDLGGAWLVDHATLCSGVSLGP